MVLGRYLVFGSLYDATASQVLGQESRLRAAWDGRQRRPFKTLNRIQVHGVQIPLVRIVHTRALKRFLYPYFAVYVCSILILGPFGSDDSGVEQGPQGAVVQAYIHERGKGKGLESLSVQPRTRIFTC